jgi:tRNA nucleotidyltransferase (CCA-adding enzyme)
VDLLHPLAERLHVLADCRELAEVVAREHGNVHRSPALDAAAVVRLFDRCDAWRRAARFEQVLQACECDARGRLGFEDTPYLAAPRLRSALAAALRVRSSEVSAAAVVRGLRGPAIGQALHQARVAEVRAVLAEAGA